MAAHGENKEQLDNRNTDSLTVQRFLVLMWGEAFHLPTTRQNAT